jgi:hypothetical protein
MDDVKRSEQKESEATGGRTYAQEPENGPK